MSGDLVILLVNVTAERDSQSFTYKAANVFRIQDGQIAEIWAYIYDLHAWDAFWDGLQG